MPGTIQDRRTDQLDRRNPPDPTSDRRSNDDKAVITLVQIVHETIIKLDGTVKSLDTKLSKHMTEETHELATAITSLMREAFPEGDPDGHRRHHELVIKQAEARAKFWEKMRDALVQYGLLGFVGWAGYAVWKAFLMGPIK